MLERTCFSLGWEEKCGGGGGRGEGRGPDKCRINSFTWLELAGDTAREDKQAPGRDTEYRTVSLKRAAYKVTSSRHFSERIPLKVIMILRKGLPFFQPDSLRLDSDQHNFCSTLLDINNYLTV